MSLVVFPFKGEDPDVIAANFESAARHPRVDEVWGVAAAEGASLDHAAEVARDVTAAHGTPVRVFAQQRVGVLRPGKGDGMNTAIRRAAERGFDRIHFYDADITNFGESWITGGERAADRGFRVVKHRFPRAATDAMITWMITRPSLALLFARTPLPRLGQPLGGELLISGEVAAALAADDFVRARSDWGIDTVITHATATLELPLYEHNLADGKRHALYGSLDEIRLMVLECLDAAMSLSDRPHPPPGAELAADPPSPPPDDLKRTVAYDVEPTLRLLDEPWSDAEIALAANLPAGLDELLTAGRGAPRFEFMDAGRWGHVLIHLLEHFELGVPPWESLAFRLWLMRVLAYTTNQAAKGYDSAIAYLERTVEDYEELGAERRWDTGGARRWRSPPAPQG